MAAHARLKNEFTENEKYYNLKTNYLGVKGEPGSPGLAGMKGQKGEEGRPLPFNQQCCSALGMVLSSFKLGL